MTLAEEIGRLHTLHRDGALNDDEFARAKARLLDEAPPPGVPLQAALNAWRRSRQERWVAGVCGGLAATTGVAVWFWRLLFAALVFCGGAGVILYLLLWIFVPDG